MKALNYREILDRALIALFRDFFRILLKMPAYLPHQVRTFYHQKKAVSRRRKWGEEGVHVPPLMIMSITDKCSLRCSGCAFRALGRERGPEMSGERLMKVFAESRELGISVILLAGGEPFMRGDILDIVSHYPDIIFPVFTNGLLIDDELIRRLKRQKNVAPIISIEGLEPDTDARRGKGVYKKLSQTMGKLKRNGLFFGVSITVTSGNYDVAVSSEFVKALIGSGARLFFYLEYVPIEEGTGNLVLVNKQRAEMLYMMDSLREKHPAIFISFPGVEEKYGGCLSSGRGFIHVGADGSVEPCPFIPYSDKNLNHHALRDALSSSFLRSIRENHDKMNSVAGGCPLWENREWVKSLVKT